MNDCQSMPIADYIFYCVLSVKGVLELENWRFCYLGSCVGHLKPLGYFGADMTLHYLPDYLGADMICLNLPGYLKDSVVYHCFQEYFVAC